MRRLSILLAAAISVIAGSHMASAAPVPAYNWTGFYVGGHVGYGWADKDWTFVDGAGGLTCAGVLAANNRCDNSHTPDGFLGGAQAGFNWQMDHWLVGVEGQWSWTDWEASSALSNDGTDRFHTRVNWVATVAPRLGYAFDHYLLYVKGGAAFANEKHWLQDLGGVYLSASPATRAGWMVGVGGEYAVWHNWSIKLEYDYMDFGTKRYTLFDTTGNGYWESYDVGQTVQIIKVGFNYHFSIGN
jgi:outer membrane immunogenic protein